LFSRTAIKISRRTPGQPVLHGDDQPGTLCGSTRRRDEGGWGKPSCRRWLLSRQKPNVKSRGLPQGGKGGATSGWPTATRGGYRMSKQNPCAGNHLIRRAPLPARRLRHRQGPSPLRVDTSRGREAAQLRGSAATRCEARARILVRAEPAMRGSRPGSPGR